MYLPEYVLENVDNILIFFCMYGCMQMYVCMQIRMVNAQKSKFSSVECYLASWTIMQRSHRMNCNLKLGMIEDHMVNVK